MSDFPKNWVKQDVCELQLKAADRGRLISVVTTPTVTEVPRRREPVSADTFLGELALAEQRLYGDTETGLIALGVRQVRSSCQLELFGPAAALQEGYF